MENRQLDSTTTIEELRNSGKYPIVDLKIFDSLSSLAFSNYSLFREQEVFDQAQLYLEDILSLSVLRRKQYLKTLKSREIVDTNKLEQEDAYLIEMYMQMHRQHAIDYLLKKQEESSALTKEILIEAHKKLLQGTSSNRYTKNDYRTTDNTFVTKSGSAFEIHYFALPTSQIEDAMMNLMFYYNSQVHNEHPFINPIIIHGLIGALQMFDDGNTRLGRTLQSLKMYELLQVRERYDFASPFIYSSRSYLAYRHDYRDKLGEVAICPNEENWDQWIKFNLLRLEEQIFYNRNKLKEYKKIL